jgi:hypothetical protein
MKNSVLPKRRMFNLMLSLAFVFIFVGVAYPCKCVKQTLSKYYKSADAVVLAKVIEINSQSENTVEVKLEISDSWKSNITKIFTISVAKTSCEYALKVGEEHLLYLKKFEAEKWTTNQCMGNLLKNKSANVQKWLRASGKKANVT